MCRLSHFYNYPTLVAQSDVHSVGDLDLIPTGSGNILSWRLIMKDFLVILSHPLKGSCQPLAKEYAQVLINSLEV